MKTYLVDYENVNESGLNGISKLNADYRVILFYTENANKMSFGLHRRLNESGADIQFQKVEGGGKNALDFQLSTCLGALAAESKGDEFFIVSKDKGFQCLCPYWAKRKVKVSCVADVAGKDFETEKAALIAEVKALVKDEKAGEIIAGFVQRYKTKNGVSNALQKEYKDSRKAGEYYNAIKPLLKDKK
ncbi:MAG TPA: PIN domain-containing protein [Clostridiales bacterium]|nr:PIN domain-containing protein [Clostridiales bacterium]